MKPPPVVCEEHNYSHYAVACPSCVRRWEEAHSEITALRTQLAQAQEALEKIAQGQPRGVGTMIVPHWAEGIASAALADLSGKYLSPENGERLKAAWDATRPPPAGPSKEAAGAAVPGEESTAKTPEPGK